MIEPDQTDDQNKSNKQKIKSLSMNWEQITIDKKTNDTQNIKPNNFNFTTRPNVIEKIEKLNSNNLIQLINQQTSCAVKN